ncbi:alpha/beta-hydrolase [Amniculicola lignicola CBS 123094]|uniref:Alpha/beta-hydrolase n=1 Tax=Amniculicola lignicola CBS 123094 TaxID=1392246 RepID=A0A6A5WEL1_9PLEO|nr:alpha/beta-hydrolase [Amniculicola lignicola CBS 123094]
MPVNTITVASAVTPTVMATYISHYLNRGPLRQKPTAHISYHEGLELIRRFLHYASFHTVEELQAFTSQWVPVPTWVHVREEEIPAAQLAQSATYIQAQLGEEGIKQVGGKTWWQWRRDDAALKAEWIEMRKDYTERKKVASKGQRILLYVHGGAYFFGSVDEHRYQMQRHARKLRARVLAPRYRLAPQFPFPCGLMDCLATYLHLLEQGHAPSTILLAGDSAGGGMILSILVILRDQGIPLPAGGILISPWVDLTHSFPSLSGDSKMDYIPPHGFVHKPSASWPPPNADDLLASERSPRNSIHKEIKAPRLSLSRPKEEKEAEKVARTDRVRGFSLSETAAPLDVNGLLKPPGDNPSMYISPNGKYSIGPKGVMSVQLEETRIEIKDQIQLYAANHLLTHPLVSPALQPSLGGLPPLLIQVGGGELLRDEQIYIAHKAAQPLAYLPPPSNSQTAESIQAQAARHRPTNVQLQVWDDLCHVAPTLSFTRPAKHMYRSIAQFGAWALARAQKTTIDILDDDSISFVSTNSSVSSETSKSDDELTAEEIKLSMPQSAQHVGFESVDKKESKDVKVGKAGDPLPSFERHMIRQRVDRHGFVYPLPPPTELAALNMTTDDIGVPKPGPLHKWMKAQEQWNTKFAKQKLKMQKKRMRDMEKGYEGFDGEIPPPTALAGRRVKGMQIEKKKGKSWGMSLWSLWGSKHDEATIVREEQADNAPNTQPSTTTAQPTDGSTNAIYTNTAFSSSTDTPSKPPPIPPKSRRRAISRSRGSKLAPNSHTAHPQSRSRSRHSGVTDKGQIAQSMEELEHLAPPHPGFADATRIAPERLSSPLPSPGLEPERNVPGIEVEGIEGSRPQSPQTLIPESDTGSTRPTRGGVAYPFRLKVDGREVNASTATLHSLHSVMVEEEEEEKGKEKVVDGQVDIVGARERPGVERFVTAQEDLNMVAKSE